MKKEEEDSLLGCLSVLITILLMPLFIMLRGVVLVQLWQWFIVGPFSLRPLGTAEAIGIALVASYLTHQTSMCKKEDDHIGRQMFTVFFHAVVTPLLALLMGWVVKFFI